MRENHIEDIAILKWHPVMFAPHLGLKGWKFMSTAYLFWFSFSLEANLL